MTTSEYGEWVMVFLIVLIGAMLWLRNEAEKW